MINQRLQSLLLFLSPVVNIFHFASFRSHLASVILPHSSGRKWLFLPQTFLAKSSGNFSFVISLIFIRPSASELCLHFFIDYTQRLNRLHYSFPHDSITFQSISPFTISICRNPKLRQTILNDRNSLCIIN